MSYTPEEEKARNNKKLLKAWGALLTAITVAGGTGYSMGSGTPPEVGQIEVAPIVRLENCEQVRFGDINTYHCGDKLVIIAPR